MKFLLFLLIATSMLQAKYFDSKSCAECHDTIYEEHTKSMHHNSTIFRDEVHKKVADMTSKDKYECALCHMPSTPNLRAVMQDKSKIDESLAQNQDGVSCFYCHQIDKVHKSKSNNINFVKSNQKPVFYGNLYNPDFSDMHASAENEIFKNSEVCMGCHSHKENDFGLEVCNAKNEYDETSNCIACHMSKRDGAVEKNDKKNRKQYANHEFASIRSAVMVKEAVALELKQVEDGVELSITNKMGHSIITQPMRLKFVKTTLKRGDEIIWSNFSESALEDKEATFVMILEDSEKNPTIPANAVAYKVNQNLKANTTKTLTYKLDDLQKGDIVTSTWVSFTINPNIAKKLNLSDEELSKPIFGESKSIVIK